MKKVLVSILIFVEFFSTVSADFTDTKNHPYEAAIRKISEQGIVSGYADYTYRPDQELNRAEFIKIVLEGAFSHLSLELYGENCFSDITDTTQWYVPYACIAKEKGIIDGYEGKYLRAESQINFAEAAKIIVNTYSAENLSADSVWYAPYVGYLFENNLSPQSVSDLNQPVTRGEMAELIYRFLLKKNDPVKLSERVSFVQSQHDQLPEWDAVTNSIAISIRVPDENSAENQASEEKELDDTMPVPAVDRKGKYQAVTPGNHPGEYVGGQYLSSYKQWTKAGYAPSVDSLDLITDIERAELRNELTQALNSERDSAGKETFLMNHELLSAAQNFADHLVVNAFYSHMDMFGNEPFDRVKDHGFHGWVAESMVWRKSDPAAAINWWKNSSLHWNNIMDARFRQVGVGVAREPNGGHIFILLTGE